MTKNELIDALNDLRRKCNAKTGQEDQSLEEAVSRICEITPAETPSSSTVMTETHIKNAINRIINNCNAKTGLNDVNLFDAVTHLLSTGSGITVPSTWPEGVSIVRGNFTNEWGLACTESDDGQTLAIKIPPALFADWVSDRRVTLLTDTVYSCGWGGELSQVQTYVKNVNTNGLPEGCGQSTLTNGDDGVTTVVPMGGATEHVATYIVFHSEGASTHTAQEIIDSVQFIGF